MKWQSVSEQPCSIARSLSVIGDKWTLLILRNCFLGIRRFEGIQTNLGVTRHVLAERLKRLVENDILKKVPYTDRQVRYEYRLTEKGKDLYPTLLTLAAWGDKWMDEEKGPPVIYMHKSCQHQFVPTMVCSACNTAIGSKDVVPLPGPGLLAKQQAQ